MPSNDSRKDRPRGEGPPGKKDAPSLEEILDRYLLELAEGKNPDREAYLRTYPKSAAALRGVFRTLDFIEAAGKTLNASKLEEGRMLGDFRIVREKARGGMGVVYEAVQVSLDRRVALKVLPAGAMLSGSSKERFLREAATAGRLHHTNIVPVYAVGEEEGVHYFAMQFIEGRSLSEHLKELEKERIPPGRDYFRRVARWGREAAEALAYAHEKGVIHRDIKPSNLLLDDRDNIWVTDFGLARTGTQVTITATGDLIGTARYMSPEQARGGSAGVDERTDIYSLGATLYELLALKPAFEGETREEILNGIASIAPDPLRRIDPAIPRDLETIVAKCMEKEADRRYASAAEAAEDLRRFGAGEPILARRTPLAIKAMRWVGRHRTLSGAILLALALAAATILLSAKIRQVHEERRLKETQARLDEGRRLLDEAYDSILFGKDAKGAAALLDKAEALGIDSAKLFFYRGLIPLFNGRTQDAFAPLAEALRREPGQAEAVLALAYAHSATGDTASGLRYLKQVPEEKITTALGWHLRGLALSSVEEEEAVAAFNKAITLRPDFTPAIEARAFHRGNLLLAGGDRSQLEPMLDDFDAWVVFRPGAYDAYSARAAGWLMAAAFAATRPELEKNRDAWLDNCRRDLEKAIELSEGKSPTVLATRGTFLRFTGDFRGSAAAFSEAIKTQDGPAARQSRPGLVHHYALSLYALGEIEAALEAVEPACRKMPGFYPFPLQRALLLAELGRLDEARKVCRKTLDDQRENPDGFFLSAAVLELLGDARDAAAAVEGFSLPGAAGSPPTGPRADFRRGILDFLSRRIDSTALLKAAGDNPGRRCESFFLLALRELGAGKREKGLEALKKCLETEVLIYVHYRFTQAFEARARSDPEWPRWIAADG